MKIMQKSMKSSTKFQNRFKKFRKNHRLFSKSIKIFPKSQKNDPCIYFFAFLPTFPPNQSVRKRPFLASTFWQNFKKNQKKVIQYVFKNKLFFSIYVFFIFGVFLSWSGRVNFFKKVGKFYIYFFKK